MTRFGATIVFKEGLTRKQCEQAMRKGLDGLIELGGHIEPLTGRRVTGGKWVENTDAAGVLQSFNDEHGGPVWYIP